MQNIEKWDLKFLKDGSIEGSLLPEEKCRYCGRELLTQQSIKSGVCGRCIREKKTAQRTKIVIGAHCDLRTQDPDFNYGKGERFIKAFSRALARGDFK